MSLLSKIKKTFWVGLLAAILLLRFLFLDFGLPLVFQADEVELLEYPLNYAVNFKNVFTGDLSYLKPFSFVYGTLPTYLNTLLLVPFLKFTSMFDLSQDRYFIYLYLRSIYAVFSVIACIGVYFLAKEITNNKRISYIATVIFSLNYLYLWLSKYLNNDTLIVLFTIYFLIYYLRYKNTHQDKFLYISMLFLGFGISTKVTFAILLLYPLFDLLLKKKYKKLSISVTMLFFIYLVTNPFSFINFFEFIQRILEMRVKENGIVIDSYSPSPLKYLFGLTSVLTIPILVFGLFNLFKKISNKQFDIVMFVLIFNILFFSFSARYVERWLIPVFPILIIYALQFLYEGRYKFFRRLLVFIVMLETFFNFYVINVELSFGANLSRAVTVFKEVHSNETKKLYLITERGLNPFNTLRRTSMLVTELQFNPYVSEGAFNSFPDDPRNYDYIVFSTKVRNYYQNPNIEKINPEYTKKWEDFYKTLNSEEFQLLYNFNTPFRSIINQEDILIFKKRELLSN